mmetsp:Transcript_27023/g.77636  ORF Transcript_27023/g.77636 Transcript_27023/m.77636 type:complete len:208 (+) Transcript_27023:543-1166(+)
MPPHHSGSGCGVWMAGRGACRIFLMAERGVRWRRRASRASRMSGKGKESVTSLMGSHPPAGSIAPRPCPPSQRVTSRSRPIPATCPPPPPSRCQRCKTTRDTLRTFVHRHSATRTTPPSPPPTNPPSPPRAHRPSTRPTSSNPALPSPPMTAARTCGPANTTGVAGFSRAPHLCAPPHPAQGGVPTGSRARGAARGAGMARELMGRM